MRYISIHAGKILLHIKVILKRTVLYFITVLISVICDPQNPAVFNITMIDK